jgi:predicted DNA binding CopG/RHH family protein
MKKKYNPAKVRLSKSEKKLQDVLDLDHLASPSKERQAELKSAAMETLKELKDARTNIRMESSDMESIRKLAKKAGIPYQTFIAHVLHLYVTGQLVNIEEVRKLAEAGLLNKSKTG